MAESEMPEEKFETFIIPYFSWDSIGHVLTSPKTVQIPIPSKEYVRERILKAIDLEVKMGRELLMLLLGFSWWTPSQGYALGLSDFSRFYNVSRGSCDLYI